MLVFWWTGKGYLTALVLIAVFTIFGMVLDFAKLVIADERWYWGLAFFVASGTNWKVGRRFNAKKIAAVRSDRFRDTLIYRARHKFVSLPLETWSIPMLAIAMLLIFKGIFG